MVKFTVVWPQEQNTCKFSLLRTQPNGVATWTLRSSCDVHETKNSVCDDGIAGGTGITTLVVKEVAEIDRVAEDV